MTKGKKLNFLDVIMEEIKATAKGASAEGDKICSAKIDGKTLIDIYGERELILHNLIFENILYYDADKAIPIIKKLNDMIYNFMSEAPIDGGIAMVGAVLMKIGAELSSQDLYSEKACVKLLDTEMLSKHDLEYLATNSVAGVSMETKERMFKYAEKNFPEIASGSSGLHEKFDEFIAKSTPTPKSIKLHEQYKRGEIGLSFILEELLDKNVTFDSICASFGRDESINLLKLHSMNLEKFNKVEADPSRLLDKMKATSLSSYIEIEVFDSYESEDAKNIIKSLKIDENLIPSKLLATALADGTVSAYSIEHYISDKKRRELGEIGLDMLGERKGKLAEAEEVFGKDGKVMEKIGEALNEIYEKGGDFSDIEIDKMAAKIASELTMDHMISKKVVSDIRLAKFDPDSKEMRELMIDAKKAGVITTAENGLTEVRLETGSPMAKRFEEVFGTACRFESVDAFKSPTKKSNSVINFSKATDKRQ